MTTIQKPKSGSLFSRSQKSTGEKGSTAADVVSNVASNIAELSCSNDVDLPPAVAPPSTTAAASATGKQGQLEPCSVCGSAIRWANAAGQVRCVACQPPKFASLVRRREVLVVDPCTGVRRWETLVAMPDGRLLSETGIRELVSRGELDPLTAAHLTAASVGVGVGGRGEGVAWGEVDIFLAATQFDRWRELNEAETERFFESQKRKVKT